MNKKSIDYTYKVNQGVGTLEQIDTVAAFDESHIDADISAIDRFTQKTKELNKLQSYFSPSVESEQNERETISNLLILGFVSAVESYLREIIRRIILIDKSAQKSCFEKTISYGAAIAYSKEHLPEALLESYTFISGKNIKDALKVLLGIKEELSSNVKMSLEAYDKVCQIRHCIVHRYGRLGSRNAIKLGLEMHTTCLEKPLRMQLKELQNVITILKIHFIFIPLPCTTSRHL